MFGWLKTHLDLTPSMVTEINQVRLWYPQNARLGVALVLCSNPTPDQIFYLVTLLETQIYTLGPFIQGFHLSIRQVFRFSFPTHHPSLSPVTRLLSLRLVCRGFTTFKESPSWNESTGCLLRPEVHWLWRNDDRMWLSVWVHYWYISPLDLALISTTLFRYQTRSRGKRENNPVVVCTAGRMNSCVIRDARDGMIEMSTTFKSAVQQTH